MRVLSDFGDGARMGSQPRRGVRGAVDLGGKRPEADLHPLPVQPIDEIDELRFSAGEAVLPWEPVPGRVVPSVVEGDPPDSHVLQMRDGRQDRFRREVLPKAPRVPEGLVGGVGALGEPHSCRRSHLPIRLEGAVEIALVESHERLQRLDRPSRGEAVAAVLDHADGHRAAVVHSDGKAAAPEGRLHVPDGDTQLAAPRRHQRSPASEPRLASVPIRGLVSSTVERLQHAEIVALLVLGSQGLQAVLPQLGAAVVDPHVEGREPPDEPGVEHEVVGGDLRDRDLCRPDVHRESGSHNRGGRKSRIDVEAQLEGHRRFAGDRVDRLQDEALSLSQGSATGLALGELGLETKPNHRNPVEDGIVEGAPLLRGHVGGTGAPPAGGGPDLHPARRVRADTNPDARGLQHDTAVVRGDHASESALASRAPIRNRKAMASTNPATTSPPPN